MGYTAFVSITVKAESYDILAEYAVAELQRFRAVQAEHEALKAQMSKEEYDKLRLWDNVAYDHIARMYLEALAQRSGEVQGRTGIFTWCTGIRRTHIPDSLEALKNFFFSMWSQAIREERGEISDWDGTHARDNVVMIYQDESDDFAKCCSLRVKWEAWYRLTRDYDSREQLKLEDIEFIEHEGDLPFTYVTPC